MVNSVSSAFNLPQRCRLTVQSLCTLAPMHSMRTSTFTLGQAILLSRNSSLGQCSLRPTLDFSFSVTSTSASKAENRIRPRRLQQVSWRSYSSLATSDEKVATRAESSGLEETKRQAAFDRLRPVIDSFEGPVDWAVAYGSGVIHQANRSPAGVVGGDVCRCYSGPVSGLFG